MAKKDDKTVPNVVPGVVIRIDHFTHIHPTSGGVQISEGFKAKKDMVFACLLLGIEPKDGSQQINVDDWLKEQGWTPPQKQPTNDDQRSSKSGD